MRSRRTTPGTRSTSGSSSTASTGTRWRSGTRLSIGCEASRAADGRTGQQDLRHGAGHRQRALPPPLSTIGCPDITSHPDLAASAQREPAADVEDELVEVGRSVVPLGLQRYEDAAVGREREPLLPNR